MTVWGLVAKEVDCHAVTRMSLSLLLIVALFLSKQVDDNKVAIHPAQSERDIEF